MFFKTVPSLLGVWVSILSMNTIAGADIVATSGSAIEVLPPASVIPQDTESNTNALAFHEITRVLTGNLVVDAILPGTYTSPSTGTILAGTLVSSYYLHADKIGDSAVGVAYAGSITFDEPIIGVIGSGHRLNLSGQLNHPATLYGTNVNRGWEFGTFEFFTITADRMTLVFQNSNSSVADQLRIMTSPVPEPGSSLLLMLACLGWVVKRTSRLRVC